MKKIREKIRGLFGAVIDCPVAAVPWSGFNLLLPLRRDVGVPRDGTVGGNRIRRWEKRVSDFRACVIASGATQSLSDKESASAPEPALSRIEGHKHLVDR